MSHTGFLPLSDGIVDGVCEKLCALSSLCLVCVQAFIEVFCKALADSHLLCEAGFFSAEVGLGYAEDSAYCSVRVSQACEHDKVSVFLTEVRELTEKGVEEVWIYGVEYNLGIGV